MAGERVVDFYYSIGSRYFYLASTQMAKLEAETGCRIRWRPVDGREIRKLRGRDPFAGEPLSGQYEWAYRRYDAECWADYYGIPFREPPNPHFDYRLLVKAATAAKRLGAVVPYSHALFRSVWVEGVWPLTAVCDCAISTTSTLGGTYGDPEAGDPVRYDQLRIEHDQGELGDIAARHLPGVACCRRASAPPG